MAGRAASSDPAGPSSALPPLRRSSSRLARPGLASSSAELESHPLEDDRFDRAVTALRQALCGYRTGDSVKGCWTATIDEFCRRPNCSPFEFGVWALKNIGAENVLVILTLEFGTERLEDTYNTRRKDSASLVLSKYLGLSSAHLLALWFGADRVRSPEARTISMLRTAICEGDSSAAYTDFSADRKAQNLDRFIQACKTGFEHWAERLGLDLGQRSNKKNSSSHVAARTCCIWASNSTLSALTKDQRRLARLRPSDLQLSRGSQREDSRAQSAPMENRLTAAKRGAVVGGADGESSDLGSLCDGGESTTIVAQVEASGSNAASRKGKTVLGLPKPVIAREDDDGNDDDQEDLFQTLGLSKKHTGPPAVGNNDAAGSTYQPEPATPASEQDIPLLPKATDRPDATATEISQPFVSMPKTPGNDYGHQPLSTLAPPLTAQAVPETPSTAVPTNDRDTTDSKKHSDVSSLASFVFDETFGESRRNSLQSQLTEPNMSPNSGDSSTSSPLKRQRHFSAAEVAPARSPKRARVTETATEQPQQLPETRSPNADQEKGMEGPPSPEGGSKQFQDMQDVMVATLQDDKRWLGGETVDYFVQWAAFSNRSYTTATSLMLKGARAKDSLENLAFSKLFVDIETSKPVANVLLGLNTGNTHWIAALLDVSKWTITVYDSLHRPGESKRTDRVRSSVGEILSVLEPLLPNPALSSGRRAPEIVFAPSHALQSDGHNCGVYTIVNSFFLAAGLTPPTRLNGGVWRSILVAMATRSSIASTVAALHPIDARALADELRDRVDQDIPLQFTNMGEYVACAERRLKLMRVLRLGICRDTSESIGRAMRWLERDVLPVMSALEKAATSEIPRLRDVLQAMDAVAAQTRLAASAGSLAGMAQIYDTALQSAEKQVAMVRRAQKLRLDRAESCVRAIQALDLEGVMQSLMTSKKAYQDEAEAVETELAKLASPRSNDRT